MGSIALEKGVEYQLYFAAANNFYPPSVDSSWVAANDCIDIAHGSAYYGDNTTLIFRHRCAAGDLNHTKHIS